LDSGCPYEVQDAEFVARALYLEFHVRPNNTLKWQAFNPAGDTDRLSVMRTGCMTCDECKAKALELNNDKKEYRGFALLQAGAVRLCGFAVEDSRDIYLGHAHISLGMVVIQASEGEPLPPRVTFEHKAVAMKLMDLCICRIDTDKKLPGWPSTIPWLPTQ
jgi:hypothetical protein